MPETSRTVLTATRTRRPTSVAIVAGDPVTGQGTAALLHGRADRERRTSGVQPHSSPIRRERFDSRAFDRVLQHVYKEGRKLPARQNHDTVRSRR
jgi:hypothetical protein